MTPDSTVGDIVARDGRTASVFTRHQIDVLFPLALHLLADRVECTP
jgi:hypothetical protein